MWKLFFVVLLVVVAGGGYLYWNYEATVEQGEDEVQYIKIAPRSGQGLLPGRSSDQPAVEAPRPAIRIATFNLSQLDENKLANRRVNDVLVHVIPRFDIVAVQAVRARNQGVLLRLVDEINATGRQYDFAADWSLESDAVRQYSAFLFDRESIEIDQSLARHIEDPQDRFHHKPLVAAFRVRGPDTAQAFTFKLINVHTAPDRADAESDLLDDVYKAVRAAGRNEDDIILLGDFAVDADRLGQLGRGLDISASITHTPTTLRGRQPVDNILFDRRATTEFTGRSGVLDLVRQFDLTIMAALEVSEHLPVWAEFGPYEGVQSLRVAEDAGRTTQ